MEKALFPMRYLNVTQEMNNTYSHQGTKALDLAGKDQKIDEVFAPFTGAIKKIYKTNGNQVWLESLEKVKYADGTKDYMTIMLAHDNDVSDLWVGKIIKQGEVFYNEGIRGNATGNHIHLNVGQGKFTDSGWYQNKYGKWVINNQIDPTKALWIKSDTIIINDGGYNWKKTDNNTFEEIKNNFYIVKTGDTLSKIAKKYNISWQNLYDNNIKVIGSNPNLIRVGQVLVIPPKETVSNSIYHTVVIGDTLSKIAKIYNISWQNLYDINKQVIGNNPNLIKIGQVLVIIPKDTPL